MTLYQLTTTYACGGIWVQDRRIVDACPIYRRYIGCTAAELQRRLGRFYVACVPAVKEAPTPRRSRG